MKTCVSLDDIVTMNEVLDVQQQSKTFSQYKKEDIDNNGS
jgi:hypothetical protein